ncbi:MAG: hypothetical protein QM711_08390 [Micropruina sp.]|uniref:hypothetical protein n=1 Tax=Micropruina sp. TaxID=2737536 RepID=UPI0039E63718
MNLTKYTGRMVAAGLIAAASAVGFAGSAHAVAANGCSAVPLTPTFSHVDAAGNRVLKYTFRLTCRAGRTATVQHQIRELDLFSSDLIKNSTYTKAFPAAGTTTVSYLAAVPDTEPGGEEMYHRLRLRVTVFGFVQPWTGWHSSAVVNA